jgi:acyl-CoA hydrolase
VSRPPGPRTSLKPSPPEAVLQHVGEGSDLVIPIANGEPVGLVDALEANNERLSGVRLHQMHALHERPYLHGAYGDRMRHVSYFLSPATRQAFWDAQCDLVPNHFSDVPMLLRHSTRCDLVLAAASPPDAHGYFTLGTNAEYVARMIGHVPFFLEVNERMPRTFGENQIHESQVLGWSAGDWPLVEVPPIASDDRDETIAEAILERIPHRATLQVGIGGIPNALMSALHNRRDLGVHTELLSDGVMDLVERGVVNGTYKVVRPNKVVATFALGTRRLYDWLHDNGGVEMLPVDYVNSPRTIAREPRFVSINATTEVDLIGQCASETMAGRYWSSSGGQADFARGAMASEHGAAFIVLHSTTGAGRSRIRVRLTEGSVVTTSKNTVDHVVTEWGIAKLRGRSIADRARALIAIAHPQHRDALEAEAREIRVLPPPPSLPRSPPRERIARAEAPRG